jgi:LemA protein
VDVVKGYANYEKSLLTKITALRTAAPQVQGASINDKMANSNQISAALKTIFAVSENYPDLKADQNFLQLQQTITEIENQIADRREFYNDSVNAFNIRIQEVPYNFLAGMLGYKTGQFLQISDEEKKVVPASIEA